MGSCSVAGREANQVAQKNWSLESLYGRRDESSGLVALLRLCRTAPVLTIGQDTFIVDGALQRVIVSLNAKPNVLDEVLSHDGRLIQAAQLSAGRFTIVCQGVTEASVGFAIRKLINEQGSHPICGSNRLNCSAGAGLPLACAGSCRVA